MTGAGETGWGFPIRISEKNPEEIQAEVSISENSPWFTGHFPEEPILPGIAQIQIVLDTVKKAFDKQVNLLTVNRVRFKQKVRPGDLVGVIVAKKEKGGYAFRIVSNDEIVASGSMSLDIPA
jgi:3-hydroxymyristoyl/3-hydroxydecanoyl-(acyl carrier protein) dehydratase